MTTIETFRVPMTVIAFEAKNDCSLYGKRIEQKIQLENATRRPALEATVFKDP